MSPFGGRRPLTAAETGIYLGQQLDPASRAYWTAECVELTGDVDEPSLDAAIRHILGQAESLHGRYVADAGGLWCVTTEARSSELERVDVGAAPDPERQARVWIDADLDAPVDLARGPLFRAALIRKGPNALDVYLRAHHVALDGFGYHLIIAAIAAAYAAQREGRPLPESRGAPLARVAEEDLRYRDSVACSEDRAFWVGRLRHRREPASLARGGPFARGVLRQRMEIPAKLAEEYRIRAAARGVDLATWFAAAAAAWVADETGRTDVRLGFPLTGRFASACAFVPCMAMNIVPLELDVPDGIAAAELCTATRAALRCLRPHQRYRYEDLGRDLDLARTGGRLFGPIVNVLPFEPPAFAGMTASRRRIAAGPVDDLAIVLATHGSALSLELEANAGAYDAARLERLGAALRDGLDGFAREPGSRARRRLAAPRSFLPPNAPGPAPVDVIGALTLAASAHPDHPAIEQEGREPLTYRALVAAVRALAARLRSGGVAPEVRCAVALPRCSGAVVAELAVLWAGGAFVPLDPEGPEERAQLVLGDAAPAVVITDAAHEARIAAWITPGGPRVIVIDANVAGEQGTGPEPVPPGALAYVIYTSGSTGRPNGVMIERGALAHFAAAARERYAMSDRDRVLQFAPLQFDASIEEIYVALTAGATLVLRTDALVESIPHFLRGCGALGITVLDLPTAFWHELAFRLSAAVSVPASVRLTIIGGEAALAERVARWHAHVPPRTMLLNTYGPTETTVVCTAAELVPGRGDEVPIGSPLPGVGAVVVDESLTPVPLGEPGELCVMGPALARGYAGAEALTAARFVRLSALPGEPRAYRTGDMVRCSPQGELVYLGRRDDEVKISGHRVDPREVESAVLAVPGVVEAAVVVRDTAASKQLCAFVVGDETDETALRATLGRRLPAPAVPQAFIFAARLPRDANGKVDRRALGRRATEAAIGPREAPAAGSPIEALVLAIVSEVLGTGSVRPCSDFFAAGGRSLQALQVITRLGAALDREIPLSALFQHSTAAALARHLEAPGSAEAESPGLRTLPLAPLVRLAQGEGTPLFCVHPADGLSWCYLGLSRHLPGVPLFGLQSPGIPLAEPASTDPADLDAKAARYLELVKSVQPSGPYRLLGWSLGGGIAHAMAVALERRGQSVTLVMLDAYPADIWAGTPEPTERDALVAMLDDVDASPVDAGGHPVPIEELLRRLGAAGSSLAGFDEPALRRMGDVTLHNMRAYRTARHARYNGEVVFFRAAMRPEGAPRVDTWAPYAPRIHVIDVDAPHLGMCQPAALEIVGRELTRIFRGA